MEKIFKPGFLIGFMPAIMYGEIALVVKKDFIPAHQKRTHLACADGSFLFERKDKAMPRPLIDVNGPEYQAILHGRAMYRLYGNNYKDMMWAEETLSRLEKKLPCGDYTSQDHADFLKVKNIHARVFVKARAENGETAEHHTTTHYIWRTQHDDKVRPSHAQNDGLVFSWENPPPTGHPGEDFGCRCRAEPYKENSLQERVSQSVTTYTSSSTHTWNDDDLKYHYFNGSGRGLLLGHIGLLQGVINFSRTHTQKDGGSIFDRVARKIIVEARQNGEGSFKVSFGTSYDFSEFLFSFGDSTIEGDAQVSVAEKGEFLIVTADVYYTFWDEYKDPFDIYDVFPIDVEAPGGMPYKIMDVWSVRLEAIIKKDSSQSKYPDGEFGNLY